MKTLELTITTPVSSVFSAPVQQVSMMTTTGEITVLPHHEPLITTLGAGDVVALDESGEWVPFTLTGGCARITGEGVVILADFAEHVETLSEERIQAAKEAAQRAMEDIDSLTPEEYELHTRQLQHAINQDKIQGKWKNRKYRKL